MKKNINKFLILVVLFFLIAPTFVLAEPKSDYGASVVYKNSLLSVIGISKASEPLVIAQKITQLILSFVGIVLFAFILYAGFIWLKASDNTNEVEKAKNIIENVLYGIVIIVLAYGISEFIFSRLIGS